jgi:ribose/xylose/arabinose/galactoside ABC-type transport system permease subunit
MAEMGKLFIGLGVLLIVIGGVLVLSGKVPFVGRLPGDLHVQRERWSFYFPLTTSILISVILTLVFTFLSRR